MSVRIDTSTLNPPAVLGVIGGGQLGRMFVQAAERMGYRTVVLCPRTNAPAAQVAHEVVIGPPDDLNALRPFADKVDAVTVEFENVSAPALRWLARRMPVRPGWQTVRVSQNRLREKTFLEGIGVPVAPWRPVRSALELSEAVAALGVPLILKTAASGYDGKGQIRVETADAASKAWSTLKQVPCVAEQVVSFAAEVSCIVARGSDGRSVTYPICLNHHSHHILDATVCPAPIGPIVSLEAADLARSIADALGTVGVLTVEFFLTNDGRLLVNELAPRPHNSGHLTIEAALTSQYEQQVRALCNLPLGSPSLIASAAMVNLLGDLWTPADPSWSAAFAADPGVKLHLYGKRTPAPGRKMGHLTVLDSDPDAALTRALAARRALHVGHS
ncbi:MAG: 5-(carboxyamino)imidazole ribonucleotide synthase [Isosphaeraceae bacterium]